MARFNEILVGRINRGLQKLIGLKGEPPAPQMASDIQATLPLPLGSEYLYLDGWESFAARNSIGAVAGNFGGLQIRNATASGILVVVTSVYTFPATGTGTLSIGASNTDLTNIFPNPARLDARGRNKPTAIISSTAGVLPSAGLNTVMVFRQPVNVGQILVGPGGYIWEIPLLPGDVLQVSDQTANEAMDVSLAWRERPIEESEKT